MGWRSLGLRGVGPRETLCIDREGGDGDWRKFSNPRWATTAAVASNGGSNAAPRTVAVEPDAVGQVGGSNCPVALSVVAVTIPAQSPRLTVKDLSAARYGDRIGR